MILKFSDVYSLSYGKEIIDDIPLKPEFEEIEIRNFYIKMRDGVNLLCHGAFPVGASSLPVILMRTPYGPQSLRFFHEMAFYGYICIAQNCRGCFGSQGEWFPAKNERNDGIDTVNYIKNQPYCNANIAMTGTSYLTMCKYIICDLLPPEVKTLNFEVYSPYRHDLLYTNGMFHIEAYSGWTAYNSGIKNMAISADEAYSKMINYSPQMYADKAVLGQKLDWYRQWLLGEEKDDELYKSGAYGILKDIPKNIKVPILAHAGWYDPHFGGMLKAWEKMPEETRSKSYMIITPTNHKQGLCSDLKEENAFEPVGKRFIRSKLNWFNHHLKGQDYFQPLEEGSINAYVYGLNNYRIFKSFKQKGQRTLYINTFDKTLSQTEKEPKPLKYEYDPKNPAPSYGSEVIMIDYLYHKNKATSEGRRRIPQAGYRSDVLSFVSEPFKEDTLIENPISAEIYVSSSAPDTCFFVRLSTVHQNGEAYYLRSGITTLKQAVGQYKPNEKVKITINLNTVAALIKSGTRLRVDITSSDFPSYNAHPNTLKLWSVEEHPVTAKQTIYGGKIIF